MAAVICQPWAAVHTPFRANRWELQLRLV